MKKEIGKDFKKMLQEMESLKSKGLIEEWSLVEDNQLISYVGRYKNIGYGGKIKVKKYKEVKKHIDETISYFNWVIKNSGE